MPEEGIVEEELSGADQQRSIGLGTESLVGAIICYGHANVKVER
jgi:hypothetical protein